MSTQLELSLPLPVAVASPQRILLPDPEDQRIATERYNILQMLFDYRSDPGRFGMLRLQDGTPVTSSTRMLAYIAETTGHSERTLKYWLSRYQSGGLPSLSDRTRKDKHTSRFFEAYPKAGWLAAYLFLECRSSCKVCYEAIVRDAAMLAIPVEELPSYETVRSWLRSMPPSLATYARKGAKAYRECMSPYVSRGFTDQYANQTWVGDHMIHDVEVSNDCFANVEWGAPIRLRLSAMLDYRSRMFVGATWCWEGSSRAIASVMRRGISKYGPPECIYVDNGRDFRKVGKGALHGYEMESLAPKDWCTRELDEIKATGFLARVGCAVTYCLPYHGQSKHIERAWRSVHERFDKVWPTYTSGNPFTRSDGTSEAMMRHRKLLSKGRADESSHPKASVFIAACLAWMEEYADTPQTGTGMDGATPRQVYEANLNPRQKPSPDPATLALLMAQYETRTVQECAIRLNNRRYVPTDQAGWATLHGLNENQVIIAYDEADYENAAALDLDGNFLALLRTEELLRFAPGDPKTQAQIADSMSTRRHLEKKTRETLQAITLVARQNGAISPLEAMAKRLQLPSSTDTSDVITQRPSKFNPNKTDNVSPITPAQAARIFMEKQK